MPAKIKSNSVEFVQTQLELMQEHRAAVEREDLTVAGLLHNQLRRALPGLARLIRNSRRQAASNPEARQILELAGQLHYISQSAIERLQNAQRRLAEVLHELKRGRQVLSVYRTGMPAPSALFEIRS
ncbi:MAG: hypothetical protein FJY65_05330 [Calditrichaeota bacterium]|nr:hypothetical protein [Calditrichota bacterium]